MHTVDEVFGITREIPINYVTRDGVDGLLVDSLARNTHIVIHGASKQGKTCLRKHCLKDEDYVLVQCSNRWMIGDLHSQILKRTGFEVAQSTQRTISGKAKAIAKLSIPFLKGPETSAEVEAGMQKQSESQALELDLDDPNDVIGALKSISFSRYVVLEDFHYLPLETQRDFAVALKSFHESSTATFIIVGVWMEENRLIVLNGDLTGRVLSVDADR